MLIWLRLAGRHALTRLASPQLASTYSISQAAFCAPGRPHASLLARLKELYHRLDYGFCALERPQDALLARLKDEADA